MENTNTNYNLAEMPPLEEIPFNNRTEWHLNRLDGVTGTESSAIMGENPWMTPRMVYQNHKNPQFKDNEDPNDPDFSLPMWNGTKDEAKAAEYFKKKYGKECVEVKVTYKRGHYIANPDRFIKGEPDALLEIKTTDSRNADCWYKPAYRLQVNWYMGILGKKYAYVFCLIGNGQEELIIQEFDAELFARQRMYADIFWNEYILKDVMPGACIADKKDIPFLYGKGKDIKDISGLTDMLMEYRKNEEWLKAEKEKYNEKIKEISAKNEEYLVEIQDFLKGDAGESEHFQIKNTYVCTPKINVKKLMAEMPAIYEKYKMKDTAYYRTTIKEKNEE